MDPRTARPGALRILVAAALALLVAYGAVQLLLPDGTIEPEPVAPASHFTEEQVERGFEYRSGQRPLGWGVLAIGVIVLAVVAAGRPHALHRGLRRMDSRPLLGGAAVGAALAVAVALAELPFRIAAFERSRDVGLATQTLSEWLGDAGKAVVISAALAAAGAAIAVLAMRRLRRTWWLAGSAVVVAFAVAVTWLGPVLLTPLFNDLEPLPEGGELRGEVERLAERAGVEVGEVYRIDASRRSTALNAYVGGVGPTKRVVLYDTTLDALERRELRSIVAHELAHQQGRDIPRGLLWVAIVAPFGMLFVRELTEGLGARTGARLGTPGAVPALALAMTVATIALTIVSNQLSRAVEARADAVSLELTEDPTAMIDLRRRSAVRNVSDPDPPVVPSFLFSTHPSTLERIGIAEAWRLGSDR